MTAPLRIGLKLGGQDTSADELRAFWRIADDAGFDHLWCLDLYAAIGDAGPDRPIFEGWALQAAMAVATTRIRIGCTFSGNTHRPPWRRAPSSEWRDRDDAEARRRGPEAQRDLRGDRARSGEHPARGPARVERRGPRGPHRKLRALARGGVHRADRLPEATWCPAYGGSRRRDAGRVARARGPFVPAAS